MTSLFSPQPFATFVRVARPRAEFTQRILCLDPGLTTGWCIFDGVELVDGGQVDTPSPPYMADLVRAHQGVDVVVFETYRIRGNKAQEHIGSEVMTIQLIGALKATAYELGLQTVGQTAGMAKGFATDAKLRRWGLYQTGQRHSNDSIRHGCYWLLFAAGRSRP